MSQINTDLNYRFSMCEFLSAGYMGKVYRTHDKLMNINVCMKVIPKIINGKQTRECVINEVQIMKIFSKQCNSHIIGFIDFYEERSDYYIITELLDEYLNLNQIFKNKKFNKQLFDTIVINLCIGIKQIHSMGVVHRDIKPENIMVSPDGKIKFIDFGLSCPRERVDNNPVGTPLYASPEIVFNKIIHKHYKYCHIPETFEEWVQADYWSLGITILTLALNAHPYDVIARFTVDIKYFFNPNLLPFVLSFGFPFELINRHLPVELSEDEQFNKLIRGMLKVRVQRFTKYIL